MSLLRRACRQFVDDVQAVLFTEECCVTHVEHFEVRKKGSTRRENVLRVFYRTQYCGMLGRETTRCFDMWLPPEVLLPAAAKQQPGGDAWLNMSRETLAAH